MLFVSIESNFCVIVVILCSSTVESAPHIIGGGWNTGMNTGSNPGVISGYLKSVLPFQKMSRFYWNLPSNVHTKFASETNDEGKYRSDIAENKLELPTKSFNQISSINSPVHQVSSLQPFLRQKREECQHIREGDEKIVSGQFRLNNTQILAVRPRQVTVREEQNQLTDCPNETEWPNRAESNYLSTCPWNLTKRDLGENAHPRYVMQATCLCRNCLLGRGMECKEFLEEVTYFEFQGCQNGLALMMKKTIRVARGCYCEHPPRQGTTQVTATGGLPDKDD